MKTSSRLATLAVVAIMPTAVALVAPMGMAAVQPQPVKPLITKDALLTPGAVAPAVGSMTTAQLAEARKRAAGEGVSVRGASSAVALPDHLAVVGVSWSKGSGVGSSVQYRVRSDGAWGAWSFIDVEADHAPDAAEQRRATDRGTALREGSEPIVVTDATDVQVRLIVPNSRPAPTQANLSVIDPGSSPADASAGAAPGSAMASSTQPTIYTRAQWGADESLRDPAGPSYGTVKAAFVHHTAGSNTYTSDDVPAIIRGIYAYHVNGNGWADIGYNFLVDKFGRTWEGRYGGIDKAVIGAHTYGVNDETFGVSVLGTYSTTVVPSAVTTALTNLIAWKADVHGYNPLGTAVIDGYTYPTVEGHRAAYNNSTECPGDMLYAKLPDIRKAAGAITDGSGKYVERWSGVDRYATAAAVSLSTFPNGAPVAFVATGSNFPDALAAGPAGAKLGGPMLLTGRDALPQSTSVELKRLKPQKIIMLGGSDVVSDGVASQLAPLATEVTRWSGADRYATAAQVSASAFPGGASTAFIATGANFPDALAGGPAGDQLGGPMLLSATDALPATTAAELKRLAVTQVVLLGGSDVVSDAVAAQVQAATGVTPVRWSGADRYSTAATVSAKAFPGGSDVAFVSTGADFPDALSGGPAGGALNAPLLLTGRDTLPQSTIDELKRLTPSRIIVLGGSGVVSDAVAVQLRSYLP